MKHELHSLNDLIQLFLIYLEAATRGVVCKKVFLQIS